MANYDLPAVVEKRVRYFDGQFLQDQDFIDEQDYQLDREHRHNRLLHGPGIAEGLAVTSAAANQVTVAPGTALDSDGHQLVLAQATNVDLPAKTFNNQQGVQLYLSYLESAEDPQTTAGSANFTRWLERPELTALVAGQDFDGTSPPVLLAKLALDGSGRVAIDVTVRDYAGLRLPGPNPDAPILTSASDGIVELAGSLAVDGQAGIGTVQPDASLHVNVASTGTPVHGAEIDVQSFQTMANAQNSYFLRARDIGAGGTHFLIRGDGLVGIGTGTPGAKLEVAGGGGMSVDLLVNGRLRSNSNDGGLFVAQDRFIGGFDTSKIGIWNGNAFRLTVLGSGNVGVGTTNPGAALEVAGAGGGSVDLLVNGRLRSNSNDGGLWVSSDRFIGGVSNQVGFYTGNAWRLVVNPDGTTGLGTAKPMSTLHVNVDSSGQPIHAMQIDVQSFQTTPNAQGSHFLWVRDVGAGAGGNYFYIRGDGMVGIGTPKPGARLEIMGGGGSSVDLLVNGRLKSNSNDGGLWVSGDRFVGGIGNQIGFWSNNAWRVLVNPAGQVSIGAAAAATASDLEIGSFYTDQDRYIALKATGGNVHRVGMKLFTWQENFGYSLQFDERGSGPDGFHVKFHNVNADGVSRLYIDLNGNVGIGTTTVGTKLSVAGNGYIQSDFFVNGRLVYWWGPDGVWKQVQNRASDYAGSYTTGGPPSDLRLKTDLRQIGGAMDMVRQLNGQRYRWGTDGVAHFTKDIEGSVFAGPTATEAENQQAWQAERRRRTQRLAGDHIGLIAQDVEAVLPELVQADEDGYKHISYQHLTAVLVEAIKEQDAAVRALTSEIAALRQGQQD